MIIGEFFIALAHIAASKNSAFLFNLKIDGIDLTFDHIPIY